MAYREVGMVQAREIVRRWLAGDGLRSIARALGVDRKTVAEYVRLAQAAGVARGGAPPSEPQFDALAACRRPGRPMATMEPSAEVQALIAHRSAGPAGHLRRPQHGAVLPQRGRLSAAGLPRVVARDCDRGSLHVRGARLQELAVEEYRVRCHRDGPRVPDHLLGGRDGRRHATVPPDAVNQPWAEDQDRSSSDATMPSAEQTLSFVRKAGTAKVRFSGRRTARTADRRGDSQYCCPRLKARRALEVAPQGVPGNGMPVSAETQGSRL
jgi:hypothetical protein